jgi:hypothetical protein
LSYEDGVPLTVCYLPLSGIYWQDEILDMTAFARLPDLVLRDLLALFGIRAKIWRHDEMTAGELQFWADARVEIPNCPIFRRLAPSAEEMAADKQLKEACDEIFAALIQDADSVEVTDHENGVQSYSAVFKIRDHDDGMAEPDGAIQGCHDPTPAANERVTVRSWWQRIFRHR